jgi:hypothetical protein
LIIGTSDLHRGKASKRNHHGFQDHCRSAGGIITLGIPFADDINQEIVSTTKSEARN